MGTLVLKDAYILINAVNESSNGNQVSLPLSIDTLEKTAFGNDTHINQSGLKSWTIDVEFNQDFAAAGLDERMFALWNAGAAIAFEVRPTSGARSTSNPAYTANGIIKSYEPIGNSVGELAGCKISVVAAGTLTRQTT
jgi:hypothetical protein